MDVWPDRQSVEEERERERGLHTNDIFISPSDLSHL